MPASPLLAAFKRLRRRSGGFSRAMHLLSSCRVRDSLDTEGFTSARILCKEPTPFMPAVDPKAKSRSSTKYRRHSILAS